MELNKAEILEGLLSYNYFPAQKKDNNELPPNISSWIQVVSATIVFTPKNT